MKYHVWLVVNHKRLHNHDHIKRTKTKWQTVNLCRECFDALQLFLPFFLLFKSPFRKSRPKLVGKRTSTITIFIIHTCFFPPYLIYSNIFCRRTFAAFDFPPCRSERRIRLSVYRVLFNCIGHKHFKGKWINIVKPVLPDACT